MEEENEIVFGVELTEEEIRTVYALKKSVPEYRNLSIGDIASEELKKQLDKYCTKR